MKLARFALSFAVGTLISRLLGFVRDAVVAYHFGASAVSDAFFIAFRIPNSFRRLLGEGGFNAVFVPMFTKAIEEGREREFLSKVLTFYMLVNALITLAGVLLSEHLISLIAPGTKGSETFELSTFMARFLFLYLLLVGLNALFMGVLNVKGRFFIPALSQAVFNLFFVLVLLTLSEEYGYVALILGVLLGGVCQVSINVPFLLRDKVGAGFSLKFDEEVKQLVRRLLPALGGFGVNQLSLFIDTFLASFLRTGAISYLYYANRLYQLPFGIVSVGVANSLLSILSKSSVDKRLELTNAFRMVLILTVPASAGLFILSEEVVSVIYGRGSFLMEDVRASAGALAVYSLGLVPFSLQKSLSALFFSEGDTLTPVKASLITVLSEGISAYLLAFVLGMGLLGLPTGTALSSLVGLVYLSLNSRILPHLKPLVGTLVKSLIATAVMGIAVLFIRDSLNSGVLVVLTAISAGVVVYFLSLIALREGLTLRLLKSLVEKLGNS